MISQKMQDAINAQINEELFSSYLYLSMSAFFEDMSLTGFANWMRIQAQEEQFHAMKFFDYLNERGGKVELLAIEKPENQWKDIVTVFEQTQKHEEHITAKINELVKIASDENDYASSNFLQWYVNEQVEEEATASEILEQIRFLGENKHGILMLDREFKGRSFQAPVDGE
ncbi:MAG: ferritin [delta proteobacterium ML8_F1]|nr:MAG: ferritin [delta proteobacterium ML8_F1]